MNQSWGHHYACLFPDEKFENEEYLARKTDEKHEKMLDQKSNILEAFGGGNDRN